MKICEKRERRYKRCSQFATSYPLFTLPYPALGPRELTSTDCIPQAPLSCGLPWAWPMQEGGGAERWEERVVWVFISPASSLPGHIWPDCVPLLCATPSVGLSFLAASAFPGFCSPSHFRPKDGNSFSLLWFRPVVQSTVGPLHAAHTFSNTF